MAFVQHLRDPQYQHGDQATARHMSALLADALDRHVVQQSVALHWHPLYDTYTKKLPTPMWVWQQWSTSQQLLQRMQASTGTAMVASCAHEASPLSSGTFQPCTELPLRGLK